MTENPWLVGNFAPVRDEHSTLDLPVEGSLPPGLNGLLLRNGPNPIAPDPGNHSWFMGDGMVHAIELRAGRAVSYRNRRVRTDQAAELLGENPPPGQPDRIAPTRHSAANTNIIAHGGRILALWELCLPTELTPELATVGRYDFGGRLNSPMTAHPKIDPETGELIFIGYDIFGPPGLRLHVADAAGRFMRTETIPTPATTMMHDFAITENHIIFLDLPVIADASLATPGQWPAAWRPELGARVGVKPRAGGEVRWLEVTNCYVFHVLNAYETNNDTIIVDVVRHPAMFGGPMGKPTLDRWSIDLTAGTVTEDRLDDHPQEFPRIDDRLTGWPHRYGYATHTPTRSGSLTCGGLVKHDLTQGTTQVNDLAPGNAAAEPLFAPGGPGEDDGWILSIVYDATRDGSDLVVLGAGTFTAPPIARIRLPQRIPFGFHGNWIPDPS